MNTLFALLTAGTLATAPMSNPAEPTGKPTESSYYASEQVAIWLTPDQKLHVMLGQTLSAATVTLSDTRNEYVLQYIDLRKRAVNQRYDLSAMPTGTYELTVQVGEQVVKKILVVGEVTAKRQLSIN